MAFFHSITLESGIKMKLGSSSLQFCREFSLSLRTVISMHVKKLNSCGQFSDICACAMGFKGLCHELDPEVPGPLIVLCCFDYQSLYQAVIFHGYQLPVSIDFAIQYSCVK